jgi:hypothetical protein
MKQKNDHEVAHPENLIKKNKETRTRLRVFIGLCVCIILMLFTSTGFSQSRSLNFQIVRNENKIGTVHFSENISGGTDSLKMESNVKTRFIFTFIGYVLESATFSNGVLLKSSIYRKFNGDEKANKQHRAMNTQYIISQGEKSKVMKDYPITYNMLSLYSKEPVNIEKVYSDNFEQFLSIQKVASHKYKITLPDDNYNTYSYVGGVLNVVEVHHTFYTVSLVRVD